MPDDPGGLVFPDLDMRVTIGRTLSFMICTWASWQQFFSDGPDDGASPTIAYCRLSHSLDVLPVGVWSICPICPNA